MGWSIEILNGTVAEELDAFPPDMRAKLDHVVRLIEEFGLHRVREPYVRPLRDKLWEMRVRGRDGIGRVVYVTASERRIIVLHAFRKKTRRTPRAAIEIALSRMRELER